MLEYVAEEFWAEVDKYYEDKAPYTQQMLDAATREPTEVDNVEQERPLPSILDEKNGWPFPADPKGKTSSSKDAINEIIDKAMKDLKIKDVDGKQEPAAKKGPKP